MTIDYLLIEDGAGPVEGVSPVPDLPLAGPPGTLEMVGLVFGLFDCIWDPEVLAPPAPLVDEPELELVEGVVP